MHSSDCVPHLPPCCDGLLKGEGGREGGREGGFVSCICRLAVMDCYKLREGRRGLLRPHASKMLMYRASKGLANFVLTQPSLPPSSSSYRAMPP